MNPGGKRTFLTIVQTAALSQYLGKIEERLKTEKPTYATVAEWAATELGFKVTENNVRSIADAFKIAWERQRAVPQTGGRLVTLEVKVNELDNLLGEYRVLLDTLHARLREVEAENQRIRIIATEIVRSFDIRVPASAGIPPAPANRINVTNGPK